MFEYERGRSDMEISVMKKKIAVLLLFVMVLLSGCAGDKDTSVLVKNVMIPDGSGAFIKAQIVMPSDYEEESLPLVTMAHGFRGTMNSAGAEMLAHALAENGIATIRMNFSHNVSENPGSEETRQYTVETMAGDLARCAEYMTENYNADKDRIGVFGRSLGGRAAMTAANEQTGGFDYKGLVLVAPAGNGDSFQRYMGGEEKWEEYKEKADKDGFVVHQNVVLTPEFFHTIEDYVPSENGYKFRHPVLVLYNTEDNVVLPKTSIECAESYKDHRLIKVTSKESPHGLEMGFKDSEIKDMLFAEILQYYEENL